MFVYITKHKHDDMYKFSVYNQVWHSQHVQPHELHHVG
jgi:hypothetical protein